MVVIKQYTPPSASEPRGKKFDDLVAITRELCEERNITYVEPKIALAVDLRVSECQIIHGIFVIPDINHLLVYNPVEYNFALRLAEKYEQRTKEEFTLEKRF